MNDIIATINGSPVISLRATLRRDAAPSTFEAILPAASFAPGQAVTLRCSDGLTSRELRQFAVSRCYDLGDGRVRVTGADVRSKWARLPVHARLDPDLDLAAALQRLFAAAVETAPALNAPAFKTRALKFAGVPLNVALARVCAAAGVTFTIDDSGAVAFAPAGDPGLAPDPARLISRALGGADGATAVIGGAALEIRRVTDWQAVLPGDGSNEFPEGELFPLPEALAEWGISEAQARRAALSEGGFEKLLPATSPQGAKRLEILRRHAFRMFRAAGAPWLPVGGVNEDGTLAPARLEAASTRPLGRAPDHPAADNFESSGLAPVRDGFELDCERGVLRLEHPPYALSGGGATLQERALAGAPQLRLTICAQSTLPPLRLGDGAAFSAPHLMAVYDGGVMLNRPALERDAQGLLIAQAAENEYLLAGADGAPALGAAAEVEISADDRGLVTRVVEAPQALFAPPAELPESEAVPGAVAPPGPLHQPINAYRAGPLILRAEPEGESVLAAQAVRRDPRTSALELANLGPLAGAFHLQSRDAARHGQWFFVAGAEALGDGVVRVLPDARHAPLDAPAFSPVRERRPEGLRGLLVCIGDEKQVVDCGPLVADARGREPGECSNFVADLEGPKLSETRRGGLQFLTVLALSPAHDRWVPALNLRDGDTQNDATCGRGLYAEGDGRSLGRLTAHNQGGPMLADAAACVKHFYGSKIDDGEYRESAGHISTEAFFKVPGDAVHDAPLRFAPEPFAGGVPPWPPYEAQIKYDANTTHRWNHRRPPGMWRIQYRVPFKPLGPVWTPIRPPRTPPPDDPPPGPPHVPVPILPPESIEPVVSENEIWAPSHDWVPPPSYGETGEELPQFGPSITSQGWAGEQGGVPNPANGGGVMFAPQGRPLPLAQGDNGQRQTFVVLHPEVLLAWGMPHHGAGRVHSGWQAGLAGGELVFTPVGADASPDEGTLRVQGHVAAQAIELEPQEENPGGLWADAEGALMWDDAAVAMQSQIEALQAQIDELYELIEGS